MAILSTLRVAALAAVTGALLAAAAPAQDGSRSVTELPAATAAVRLPFDPAESAGLFVGVRSFEQPDGAPSLSVQEVPYAVDDAVDLAYAFSIELGLIQPARVVLALSGAPQKDESVRRLARLRDAGAREVLAVHTALYAFVKQACSLAGRDGLLVMTFATHGLHIPDGDDCLLARDSLDWSPRTTLTARELSEATSNSKAGRTLLLFDACRKRPNPELASDRGPADSGAALSRSFADAMGEARGTLSLFAAPIGGASYDDPDRRNGVFSGAFLDALHGDAPSDERGYITLGAVASHVQRQVKTWVARNRPGAELGQDIERRGGMDLDVMPLAERREGGVAPLAGAAATGAPILSREPAGCLMLTGSEDGKARLWDFATGRLLKDFAHGGKVRAVALCPKRGLALTGGGDGTPRLWRTDGAAGPALGRHADELWAVAMPADGRLLLSGGRDGIVRVWDGERGDLIRSLPSADQGPLGAVLALAVSADGARALSGNGRTATLWDLRVGKAVGTLARHADDVMAVAFSPDGQQLATGSADTQVLLWSGKTLQPTATLPHSGAVWAVAFSPDGSRVLTGTADFSEAGRVWEAATGRQLMVLPDTRRITCVAFSPDGQWLVIGGQDGVVRLFDAQTGAHERDIDTLGRSLLSLSF